MTKVGWTRGKAQNDSVGYGFFGRLRTGFAKEGDWGVWILAFARMTE